MIISIINFYIKQIKNLNYSINTLITHNNPNNSFIFKYNQLRNNLNLFINKIKIFRLYLKIIIRSNIIMKQ